MECQHENSYKREWLPHWNGLLRLHPYCKNCGIVKSVSSDVGKDVGYFVNVLKKLSKHLEKRGYKISKAQMRLVILEFEKKGLTDKYSVSFNIQINEFVKTVKKYVKVSESVILKFL